MELTLSRNRNNCRWKQERFTVDCSFVQLKQMDGENLRTVIMQLIAL